MRQRELLEELARLAYGTIKELMIEASGDPCPLHGYLDQFGNLAAGSSTRLGEYIIRQVGTKLISYARGLKRRQD